MREELESAGCRSLAVRGLLATFLSSGFLPVDQTVSDAFIARWKDSGASERAHFPPFLIELCDVISGAPPDPAGVRAAENTYCLERGMRYTPRLWHPVMASMQTVPEHLFKKLSLYIKRTRSLRPPAYLEVDVSVPLA